MHKIDGKKFAEKIREDLKEEVSKLKNKNIIPGLAVILVGNDPASEVYVKNKRKQTKEIGMNSFEFNLDKEVSSNELLKLIDECNKNPEIDGILVQLPLPKHLNEEDVINAISPEKDVDGFHVVNSGKMFTSQESIVPCTPLGCILMLKEYLKDLSGLNAVVIGRSNIVGKPMAMLLLQENCTVTIAHSRTKNIEEITKNADIVVAAVGIPEIVKGTWIREGATVIDVGINRLDNGKLTGDVAFEEMSHVKYITPVPGGVGPMTIACLLKNTVQIAKKRNSK